MSEQNNPTTTTTAVEPKLSPREKLLAKYTKLNEKATELAAEITKVVLAINEIDALANISIGTAVMVSLGKGETAKEVEATVIGIKEDEDGVKVYKVQYGSGFDADIAVVKANRIVLCPVAAESAAADVANAAE